MFTKTDIHTQLRQMGVSPSDTVLMHTSMKAVGEVEGRAEGFLDILIDYFAEDGLFLIPTHTYANLNDLSKPTMDMNSPYTCIGLLPSLAAVHPKAHRSLHPTHSMAAFGKRAEEYIAGEEEIDTSTHWKGCYGKLYDVGGKVLLCGVGHNRDTYLHSCEERIGVPNRLSPNLKPCTIRLKNGEIRQNYYFFARLKENRPLSSTEGTLHHIRYEDLPELNMPISAKDMILHYAQIGRFTDKLYVSVAESNEAGDACFVELREF